MKKILLISIGIASIGTAGYLLLRKSKAGLKKDINDLLPASEKHQMDNVLDKMTRQELLDVRKLFTMHLVENTPKEVIEKLHPAFVQRIRAIGNKYNIFT